MSADKLSEIDCVSRVHFFGYSFVERQKSNGKPRVESKGLSILKRLLNHKVLRPLFLHGMVQELRNLHGI